MNSAATVLVRAYDWKGAADLRKVVEAAAGTPMTVPFLARLFRAAHEGGRKTAATGAEINRALLGDAAVVLDRTVADLELLLQHYRRLSEGRKLMGADDQLASTAQSAADRLRQLLG